MFALVAFGNAAPPFARLMYAAFEDGVTVWSADRMRGGAPYYSAEIGRERLFDALTGLETDGLFTELPLSNYYVPSSECSCFIVRKDDKAIELAGCHERFEASGKLVAEHHGIAALEARRRFDVLSLQPDDYLFFRMIWLELRRIMESLIPGNGRRCDGDLEMLHAEFRWRPGSAGMQNNGMHDESPSRGQ